MRAHQRLLSAAASLAHSHASAQTVSEATGAARDVFLSRAVLQSLAGQAQQQGKSALPACSRHFAAAAEAAVSPAGAAAAAAALSPSRAAGLASTSGRASLPELLHLYKQLSKWRLSALVVSTAAAGFIAGSGEQIQWPQLAWTSLGTFACAASANALNQVYEVRSDALMERTKRRPLPLGKLSPRHAMVFAAVTGLAGVTILAVKANATAAGLGAANIGLYAAVYTPLKVVSIANTWVGAVVGAVPPLIGWAAAAGRLDIGAGVLAGALYFWQLPHFLSLAWLCRGDYARGGYAMLSVFDPSGRRTAACALRNALYLLPLGGVAACLGVAAPAFAYEAAVLSGVLATTAATFLQTPSAASARRVFRASLLHLPLFMAALAYHRIPQTEEQRSTQRIWAQLRLGLAAHAPSAAPEESPPPERGPGVLEALSAAPFPFLPVPLLQLRCPSRVACEAGAEGEGTAAQGKAPARAAA